MTTFETLLKRNVAHWPAWGVLDHGYQDALTLRLAPPDWNPPGGGDPDLTWKAWKAKTLQGISDNIWPVFDLKARCFPKHRIDYMHELTAADLSITLAFQAEQPSIFERPIKSPLASPKPSTHRTFFTREDGHSDPGEFHNEYDVTLNAIELAGVTQVMNTAFDKKVHTTPAQFKRDLQRPRGLQMSLAFGATTFLHEPALTAYSPSIISGHAHEGLTTACAVIEDWILNRAAVSQESIEAMEQYATDIGDRRFMAGVHYPSDSIASWVVVLSSADALFTLSCIKDHLWRAIQKSEVYRRLTDFKESKIYDPSLQLLHSVAPSS